MIVGIDPGGAQTGVVVMNDDGSYVDHRLIERAELMSWGRYVAWIEDAIAEFSFDSPAQGEPLVAMEDLSPPSPHMGLISVKGLLDTARVIGALHYRGGPSMVLVPPGGHGSLPAEAYPPELIGPREGRALSGKLRHCRSAWDVAMRVRNNLSD
jgi:hypothetical protein